MNFETFALFAITEFLLSMTPGPAVLLVIGLSMRQGFGIGFAATLGILCTNALFFSLSALGIGALILASSVLFTALKWIGAAYLAYLGFGMLRPLIRRLRHKVSSDRELDLQQASRIVPKTTQTKLRSFSQGFTLQASNPKNLAFFVAMAIMHAAHHVRLACRSRKNLGNAGFQGGAKKTPTKVRISQGFLAFPGSLVVLQCIIRPSNSRCSKKAIRNQYTPMKP